MNHKPCHLTAFVPQGTYCFSQLQFYLDHDVVQTVLYLITLSHKSKLRLFDSAHHNLMVVIFFIFLAFCPVTTRTPFQDKEVSNESSLSGLFYRPISLDFTAEIAKLQPIIPQMLLIFWTRVVEHFTPKFRDKYQNISIFSVTSNRNRIPTPR